MEAAKLFERDLPGGREEARSQVESWETDHWRFILISECEGGPASRANDDVGKNHINSAASLRRPTSI